MHPRGARWFGVGAIVFVLGVSACGEESGPAAPAAGACPDITNPMTVRDVVFPGDRYDFESIPSGADPRAHPAFATLWNALRVQQNLQCWQAQGGTNNLQFFENPSFGPGPRYRFVGTLDTEVGAALVHSVGCYINTRGESFRAAVITTYTGDLELVVLVSATLIDHFIGHQGSFPLITRYVATAANCL